MIAGDDPCVDIWIPKDRIVLAEAMIERVRIGEHLRVQKMAEARHIPGGLDCDDKIGKWASP